jgi:hypothetical protein
MKCPRCGKDNPPSIHTCSPPTAIYLAEQIEAVYEAPHLPRKAAAELRKQYEENAQLREQNTMLDIELAKDEALLRQALEALEQARSFSEGGTQKAQIAIAALRERLKA